ncbi:MULTISPECIES: CDP-diacylglycerol--serine O-phosphatidyltransferase [Sulfurovum]|uniref:CDP-diacylglycerol--serine O-phosphatidyltransferase n=1 Tax=Sulfurovum xiamenensis TaxID=3019066 RepID=A0ABT7QPD8_9BACT|nr:MULTISPECIES: CDP-diacylglycerol--serine O-phosphatidyltransferase [Sulfurovum]EIF51012.1 CDP-diacylglycerol--serine O-phosphatidyltransferase [Sulfurovum sp. AR]MDM5262938.1 CDP-diacylglycerol--serine O-phosphatidyltransferase [Sulfurovum xiamenensis]
MKNAKLIYILPNLFTASSIFVGVISMVEASKGNIILASWLILLALVFDGLDGRIARMTNTTSQFGVEFDSLADIISFGIAPAMLLYFFIGNEFGRFGILVSALYVIFGAIRLARFNISTAKTDPNVFIGLPIPTAAIFVSMWILLFYKYTLEDYGIILLFLTLGIAVLMVSNFRYPSFKKVSLDKPMVFKTMIMLMLTASLLYLFSAEGFAIIILGYTLYGPLRALRTLNVRNIKIKR